MFIYFVSISLSTSPGSSREHTWYSIFKWQEFSYTGPLIRSSELQLHCVGPFCPEDLHFWSSSLQDHFLWRTITISHAQTFMTTDLTGLLFVKCIGPLIWRTGTICSVKLQDEVTGGPLEVSWPEATSQQTKGMVTWRHSGHFTGQ